MQLLKASALLPAVDNAAWRSQSDASRLSVLVVPVPPDGGTVLVSVDGGALLPSTGCGLYGGGAVHPAKTIKPTRSSNFFMRAPFRSGSNTYTALFIVNGFSVYR